MRETTTLKLPEMLKRRTSFVAEALAAEKQVRESGKAYRAEDVHRYIRARAAGRKSRRPKPVNW